jgi:hypothetical protein
LTPGADSARHRPADCPLESLRLACAWHCPRAPRNPKGTATVPHDGERNLLGRSKVPLLAIHRPDIFFVQNIQKKAILRCKLRKLLHLPTVRWSIYQRRERKACADCTVQTARRCGIVFTAVEMRNLCGVGFAVGISLSLFFSPCSILRVRPAVGQMTGSGPSSLLGKFLV